MRSENLNVDPYVLRAFPKARVLNSEVLSGGFINSNFKIQLDGYPEAFVLRIYERDVDFGRKEIELLRMLGPTVPVQEVIHVELEQTENTRPFAFLKYVDGITFRDLKRTGDQTAISQASYSAGKTLASIGRFKFPAPGKLGPGLEVIGKYVEGPDPVPRLGDGLLATATFQQRTTPQLQQRLHEFIWSWATSLANLDSQSSLVHCDFSARNILVKCVSGVWSVAGVIDWEFALSGPPLIDVGHFLRDEDKARPLREPHFSSGFRDGGGLLPDAWLNLSRVLDLTALVELLTREELPPDVVADLIELVRRTLDECDPH